MGLQASIWRPKATFVRERCGNVPSGVTRTGVTRTGVDWTGVDWTAAPAYRTARSWFTGR